MKHSTSLSALALVAAIAIGAQATGQQAATGGQTVPAQTTPPPPPASDKLAAPAKPDTSKPKPKTTVPTKAKPPKKKAKTAPPKPPKKPWEEFKLDPKATLLLDFTDSNPDMVLSVFARASGITILKDPSFKAQLTLASAKLVHLGDAFDILETVLGLNGYQLQKQGKLLVVAKAAPPAPPVMAAPRPGPAVMAAPAASSEESIVKVYPLQNASAAQVARVVNEVFTPQQLEGIMAQLQQGGGFNPGQPQFGRPQGPTPPKLVRASSDDYSNKVVVNAPEKLQKQVEALITDLDKSTDQPLDSKVFHLSYVTVDEAADAVQDVLNANAPTGRGAGKPAEQNQNSFGGFFYGRGQDSSHSSGSQSVIAIKQTNSIIVSATKENMVLVKQVLDSLDTPSAFVGTTSVIHLQNAKASDVANVLNQAFTKRKDNSQSENPYFLVYSDSPSPGGGKKSPTTDLDEDGKVVNIRDLTGQVNVIAEPNTNSLIVVTAPSNLKLVQKIVDKIDQIPQQVMIETIIVEANLDKSNQLGAEWSFLSGQSSGSTNFGLQSSTTPLQGGSYTLTGAGYKLFLNALQTDTRYKILDTPRIFTSDNVKAIIDVSEQVPYITSQQTGIVGGLVSNYSFLPVGVILTVTPRVTASGQVSMDIIQSADDLNGYTSYNAPIVNHRQATTTVSVKDGDTIILGGIIQHSHNITENKIPILGEIPLLGNLFKSYSTDTSQTELMVLLTPHIIRSPAEAQKLREEETKRMSKESQENLQKTIHP